MANIESPPPIGVIGALNGTEEALVLQNGVLKKGTAGSYASLGTDLSGNTVLRGAGGVEYPIQRYSVVLLATTANTAALANAVAIPFTDILQDDIGLTTLNWAANKSRVYYPATAKFIRASYKILYNYVGATPANTYRGARTVNYIEGSGTPVYGLDNQIIVPPINIGTTTEGIVAAVSARVVPAGIIDDNNWVQVNTLHDSVAATVIRGGVSANMQSWLMLEVWE